MRTSLPIKKLTLMAVLICLGITLQIFESYLPFLVDLPGGKLGLANIATLIVLYLYGLREAMTVAILRSIIGALLFGGVVGMLYSISGALLSMLGMYVAKRYFKRLSIIGVSVLGACAHSTAQVCVGALVLSSALFYTYLPLLLAVATVCGVFTGMAAKVALQYLEKVER